MIFQTGFFFVFLPGLSHTRACTHWQPSPWRRDRPDPAALGHARTSPFGICQEFLGTDQKRRWPSRHRQPRNAWEHINLLPGGRRRPCQVPIELQTCAIFCCGYATVGQAGQKLDPAFQLLWSQAVDALAEINAMTDGRGGSVFSRYIPVFL